MKKLISGVVAAVALGAASSAFAADMAYKAPPPAAPVYSWTGFYAGFNAGWTWAGGDTSYSANSDTGGVTGLPVWFATQNGWPTNPNNSRSGFIGGAQAGYNWQTGNIVWGIEADIQYSGARESFAYTNNTNANALGNGTLAGHNNFEWFGTVRGRVGWLATPMTLIYATGGFIYGKNDFAAVVSCTTCNAPFIAAASSSGGSSGWTVGGGLEYAMGGGWSSKFEYLYYEMDNTSLALISVRPGVDVSHLAGTVDNNGHIVRFGVNYKFGGDYGKAPVVAKY